METSIWLDDKNLAVTYPKLSKKTETNVAIIGGGIHGIIAAYLLSKAGKKVVLVEKDRLCSGDTGYTTAFISYISDEDLSSLNNTFGSENAKKSWLAGQSAVDLIEEIVKTEKIECDFERTPLTEYATEKDEVEDMNNEAKFAKELGFEVNMHPQDYLPLKNFGSCTFSNNAKFHPIKFLTALAKIAEKNGAIFYEQTTVRKINHGSVIALETDGGIITANQLIVATGAPLNSPYFLQAKIKPTNTYVIAGTIAKDALSPGLYIDTEMPYHYLRIDAGKITDQFILGGEDHPTGEQKDAGKVYEKLAEYLKERLTTEFKVTNQWSGQILSSLDGLPYIGRHPFYHNEFVGTCFGGDGMPGGTLAAMINSDLVLGKENTFEHLFRPGRLTGMFEFMKKGMGMSKAIMSGIFSGGDKNLDSLEAGDGMIITKKGKKIAVMKDKDGKVTAVSAVCTHMGCIINWNKTDQTWDCPCHGSRFAASGEVLRGPANTPLKSVKI